MGKTNPDQIFAESECAQSENSNAETTTAPDHSKFATVPMTAATGPTSRTVIRRAILDNSSAKKPENAFRLGSFVMETMIAEGDRMRLTRFA